MNSENDATPEIFSMLYSPGIDCDFGVDESLLQVMIGIARGRHPNRAVRAVKNWMWWDFEVSEKDLHRFEENGVKPTMLFAHYLIWDSRGHWSEGWNVKSTVLVKFEENCFFITRNTVYILVGKGSRKTVDPDLVVSLQL